MSHTLEIKDLHAKVDNREILKGLNLKIKSGEIHAIMGPNGSGKSTLCNVLMGHPKYEITNGTATLNQENIFGMETNERANKGLFLAFQHPLEIPGVTLSNFLRIAKNINQKTSDKDAEPISPREFMETMKESLEQVKMDRKFAGRSVNEGFSGGEKKRAEIVQMSILKPKFALLDEIDSGLDIDALKIVAQGIKENFKKNKPGILLITHYQRILNYITPNFVHIMANGKIIKSGGKELAHELEAEGYKKFIKT
jgi:Fe-S cluster assembly ATP-binding protein